MAKKLEAIFQGEDKIESTLFVKEVPLTRFPECDLISRKDQYFNDKLEDFHQYCLENRSKYFRAGKLTDATPVRYTTRPTAVAFEAITGEKYTTVEFCGKAVANLYSAVCQR